MGNAWILDGRTLIITGRGIRQTPHSVREPARCRIENDDADAAGDRVVAAFRNDRFR